MIARDAHPPLYKMRLFSLPDGGFEIFEETYGVIHESEQTLFCLVDWEFDNFHRCDTQEGETALQKAHRLHLRVRRVLKTGSRIAFPTRGEAFAHLKLLKRKQRQHLRRDLALVENFLGSVGCKKYSEVDEKHISPSGVSLQVSDPLRRFPFD